MRNIILLTMILFSIFCILNIESIYGQSIENWQSYTDPAKRFTLFYPPDLETIGRENFLSSVDLTLGNQNFPREFKISVTYNDDDASLLNYAQGLEISPDNYTSRRRENQLKASYKFIIWMKNFYIRIVCMGFLQ